MNRGRELGILRTRLHAQSDSLGAIGQKHYLNIGSGNDAMQRDGGERDLFRHGRGDGTESMRR